MLARNLPTGESERARSTPRLGVDLPRATSRHRCFWRARNSGGALSPMAGMREKPEAADLEHELPLSADSSHRTNVVSSAAHDSTPA